MKRVIIGLALVAATLAAPAVVSAEGKGQGKGLIAQQCADIAGYESLGAALGDREVRRGGINSYIADCETPPPPPPTNVELAEAFCGDLNGTFTLEVPSFVNADSGWGCQEWPVKTIEDLFLELESFQALCDENTNSYDGNGITATFYCLKY